MKPASDHQREIEQRSDTIERSLGEHVLDGGRLAIVQAPPGSGKTWLLLKTVAKTYAAKKRIAIAAQTNAQADDICRRFAKDYPGTPVYRYASGTAAAQSLGAGITWTSRSNELPIGRAIVVATTAKWSLVNVDNPYDYVFVEEAWQLSWADFMLLGQVGERFVLIGDPGQISPVVSVDVARWETAARAPHLAAPQLILGDRRLHPESWQLPASRRLPADAVGLVRPFYDFDFGAYSLPGERSLTADAAGKTAHDRVIDLLARGSMVGLTIPTPDSGPPLGQDDEIARRAAALVKRLLYRQAKVRINGKTLTLQPRDIGICATHRAMNSSLHLALPNFLQGVVRVDTPERWQGLERPVMIVVHPMSGVVRPSSFDLETGRLCVMASRHLAGLIVLLRDHVGETLETTIPFAEQPVGRPDVAGRGLFDNLAFWSSMVNDGRVLSA